MRTDPFDRKGFYRLVATVEAHERNAAAAARTLASSLLQPTFARNDLRSPVETFLTSLEGTADAARQMRRQIGSSARRRHSEGGQRLRDIEQRLDQWASVASAVQDCLAGREWPLVPPSVRRLDLREAQGSLVSDAFTRAHRAINPMAQDLASADRGAYADIPLDPARFVEAAHLAYRLRLATKTSRPWRFLDVGCGGGVKLALAADFFDEAVGIEIDPGYAEAASRSLAAMRAHRCRVELADALTFGGYGDFDVIYFYQPMHEASGLLELERRILAGSRNDAILIAPYPGFAMRSRSLGCMSLGGAVFMKAAMAETLDDILAETRRMGPHVYSADDDPPQGLGWLRPLWLACAANGIRPHRDARWRPMAAPVRQRELAPVPSRDWSRDQRPDHRQQRSGTAG